MNLPDIRSANVKGEKVLVRLDLDVPLSKQTTIGDDERLKAGLQTVEHLLNKGAAVIIAGHLGRPKLNQESGIRNQEYSLLPVARWFTEKLRIKNSELKIEKTREFDGWRLSDSLFILENLRFYKGEENNDPEFVKKLASLADIYVNDAFAVCHRAHASIVGVPRHLPHYAGIQLQKEVEVLSKILEKPERPFVVVVGGAKIDTKLSLVERMHHFADFVLVGGKIAQETKKLLHVQHEKIRDKRSILLVADTNDEKTDITPASAENFLQVIQAAKTVIWNGPLGKISNISEKDSEFGTKLIAQAIIKSNAYTVVGGGDTVHFLQKNNLLDKFSFASTGGGAMLAFLSREKLPGLQALTS